MDHQGSQIEAFHDFLKSSNKSSKFFHRSGKELGHDDLLPGTSLHPLHSNAASASATASMYASRGGDEVSSGRQASAPPSSYETQVYQTHDPPIAYEYLAQRQDPNSASTNFATIAAVDAVMKKYAESIFLLLRNMSDRTNQLEYSSQRLEYSLQGLKASVAESFQDTNVKMEMLENLIREVQTGVQVLHDKQEIIEANSQLTKLQLKRDAPGKFSSSSSTSEVPPKAVTQANQPELAMKQPISAPFHQQQVPSSAPIIQQYLPFMPPPSQPQLPPGHQQQLQQPVAHQESLHQQPVPSAPQQHQPSAQHQPQHVPQGPPFPQYNQQPDAPPYSSFQHGQHFPGAQQPPQYSASFSSESLPYMSSTYEPLPDRPSPAPFPSPPPSLQPHESPGVQRYEPFPVKAPAQSAVPPPYLPNAHPVHAAPAFENMVASGYGGLGYRVAQPPPASSGAGGYPRLPTAQPVKTPPGNRSPADNVIENVAAMGFPREQIMTVVRRLTDNGQPVELNVVLDKLMNGGANQPQKAWGQ